MSMERTTLKPCPFCGGEASSVSRMMSDGYAYRAVVCRTCGVEMPGSYSKDEDQAIWDWNTRQPLECEASCPLDIGRKS